MKAIGNPGVRQFSIRNNKGVEVSLMGTDDKYGVFLHEPSGFGLSNDVKTVDLKYGFFHDLKNTNYPQGTINGDLIFLPENPYERYKRFVNFLQSSDKLELSYKPFSVGTSDNGTTTAEPTYYCKVAIDSLQKEELEQNGTLVVPLSLKPLTPWYTETKVKLVLRQADGSELRYDDEDQTPEPGETWYDGTGYYGSSLLGSYMGTIDSKGHIPAGLIMTYNDSLVDPIISLTSREDVYTRFSGSTFDAGTIYYERSGLKDNYIYTQTNDTVCNTGKSYYTKSQINVTYGELEIETGQDSIDGLNYSSLYENSYVEDQEDNDLLNLIDPMSDPYIRVPNTKGSYTISIRGTNELDGILNITVYHYYRSV